MQKKRSREESIEQKNVKGPFRQFYRVSGRKWKTTYLAEETRIKLP